MAHPRCSARACPQGPPPHPFFLEGPAAPLGPASTASGAAPGRGGQRPGCGGFAKGRSTWDRTQRAPEEPRAAKSHPCCFSMVPLPAPPSMTGSIRARDWESGSPLIRGSCNGIFVQVGGKGQKGGLLSTNRHLHDRVLDGGTSSGGGAARAARPAARPRAHTNERPCGAWQLGPWAAGRGRRPW